MSEESFVNKIAESLGIKPSQLTTDDVHAKIPNIRRKSEDYEKKAVQMEAEALQAKTKAFAPETPSAERALLMRKAKDCADKAKMYAGFASTFITQLGQYSLLETSMQITDEMKEVGLIGKDVSITDWQKTVDSMQDDIRVMTATSQKLSDVMSSVLKETVPSETDVEADELTELFKQWDAETDPVKKAEIQKKIEAKSNLNLV